jgi:transcriptional regulator with XRE-family HTH domain
VSVSRTLAYANPEVLRWARESAGYSAHDAAARIGIRTYQLDMAEQGVDYLTLRQAEKAADVYERPLAALFLPQPPREPAQEAQFRRLPGAPAPPWPAEMQLLARRVRRRQDAATDLYEDLEEIPSWLTAASSFQRGDRARLPQMARDLLGVTQEEQSAWAGDDEYAPLRGWIDAVEALGVLVMQDGSMPPRRHAWLCVGARRGPSDRRQQQRPPASASVHCLARVRALGVRSHGQAEQRDPDE